MRDSPKNFHKKLLGRAGEKTAARFLKKKGYEILELNFTTRIGEIDIIAKDGDFLVFTEIKTRTDDSFGAPAEAVDKRKRAKYVKVAEEYLVQKYGSTDVLCRFDVVEIENKEINHIINAFSC